MAKISKILRSIDVVGFTDYIYYVNQLFLGLTKPSLCGKFSFLMKSDIFICIIQNNNINLLRVQKRYL